MVSVAYKTKLFEGALENTSGLDGTGADFSMNKLNKPTAPAWLDRDILC
jgi:hypothetical protein